MSKPKKQTPRHGRAGRVARSIHYGRKQRIIGVYHSMGTDDTNNLKMAKNAVLKIRAGIRVTITDFQGEYKEVISALDSALQEGGVQAVEKSLLALSRVKEWLNEDEEDFYPQDISFENNELDELNQYAYSDFGQGQSIATVYRDNLRYSPGIGWVIWTGQRWQPDTREAIVQYAWVVVRARQTAAFKAVRDAVDDNDKKRAMKSLNWAMKADSRARLEAAIATSRTMPTMHIEPTEFDSDNFLFGVKNGIVDLRSGQLIDANPKYHMTRRTGINFVKGAACPRWLQFLHEIFAGNEELIDYVQRSIGYSLTGDMSEQCFWTLHGDGSNGKSTFVEILSALTGDYGDTIPFNTFLHGGQSKVGDDLAGLRGKRLVVASESSDGVRLNEARIKAITGGDPLKVRFLHGKYFTYYPKYKIWLMSNYKPVITGSDTGIWRRVRLIPFDVKFTEDKQDRNLINTLKAELPGILQWAIEGVKMWQARGLQMDKRTEAATEQYRTEMDTLGLFLTERCVMNDNYRAQPKQLYDAYKLWAKDNGFHSISVRRFKQAIESRGFEQIKSNNSRFWLGLGILSD